MKVCSRKECKHAGKKQPSEAFYRNDYLRDGLSSYCKSCVKEARDKTAKYKMENDWLKMIIG
jgi:hypothetical protein